MLSEFKILVWPQRDIYYIPFSVAKTDPFDLKKHRSTQPPPLEKKTLLRSGKRYWTVYPKICNVMTTKTKEYFVSVTYLKLNLLNETSQFKTAIGLIFSPSKQQ